MIKRILTILMLLVAVGAKAQLSAISTAATNMIITKPIPLTIADRYQFQYIAGICDTIPLYYYNKHYFDSVVAAIHFDTTAIYAQLNLKVKYTDTAAMLTPYLRKADTATLSTRINAKLSITDTTTMLSPYLRTATGNATYLVRGGQSGTGGLVYGTTDSANAIMKINGNIVDSFGLTNGTRYITNNYGGSLGEVAMVIRNKLTYGGLYQTRLLMFGNGTSVVSNNTPFIAWGTSMSSLNQLLSYGQFNTASLKVSSTYNGAVPMVIYGAGGTTTTNISSIIFASGAWNGSGPNVPTSGTISCLGIWGTSGTSGTFAPTSGTAKRHGINDVGLINQTGGANGITTSYTNEGMTLTAAADYRCFYSTNNTGYQVYAGGTAPSAFTSRILVGTATDNTVDALQVTGNVILNTAGNKIKITTGTNSILGSTTLTAGTATVSNTSVTASSKIILWYSGALSNPGFLSVITITAGTSFVITSSNASDAGTVNYLIIN